ncbi:MAG: DNA methyltransferase [bacterium]|nr:DNA methyltransferase [bacterium]
MNNGYISSVWDFKDVSITETNYATHDFLRWYGKLIPQLVARLIKSYSEPGDLVLANFTGSGTVLLEANILGRDAIGVDSNPLSILLASVKTNSFTSHSEKLIKEIATDIESKNRKNYGGDMSDQKWFYQESFQDLMAIREAIQKIKKRSERDYCMLALASIIKKCSKIDARCVNHIVVDNKKKKVDVIREFTKKLEEMEVSMSKYREIATKSKVEVYKGDARQTGLQNSSVDLIISHPPYLGAIDYSNIYQLETKVLGFKYKDVDAEDISTNSMEKYLKEMRRVFDEMHRVLKNGHYACVVIGDNRKDGNIQPTFSYFIQYATEKLRFELKDIFIWVMSQKAGMSVKRHGNHIDHNYILVFKKR